MEPKKYLVTRVETVTIEARSDSEAEFIGEQALDFFEADTSDLQVEEIPNGATAPRPWEE